MYPIMEFLFTNIFLILIIGFGIYIYVTYKKLQEKKAYMTKQFDKYLNNYLSTKINLANEIANKILNEYGREDAVRTEIIRLQVIIKKGIEGTITDKVTTSNVINKYKVSKEMDEERYPYFKELENIKTFYDIDINSITDDIALARKDYNRTAMDYNVLASGFPMQYAIKLFNIEPQFPVFDNIIQEKYTDKYEEFEEKEPEINKITSLNRVVKTNDVVEEEEKRPNANPTPNIQIEHSKETFKPSINIK